MGSNKAAVKRQISIPQPDTELHLSDKALTATEHRSTYVKCYSTLCLFMAETERTEWQRLSCVHLTPTVPLCLYHRRTFDYSWWKVCLTSSKLKLASDCISESLCLHYAAVRPRATHSWISSAPEMLKKKKKSHRQNFTVRDALKSVHENIQEQHQKYYVMLKCQPVSCVYIQTVCVS